MVSSRNDIITESQELRSFYSERDTQFSRDFKLIALEDELREEGLESFVGNDPRTLWSVTTYLLQPKPFVFNILTDSGNPLSPEAEVAANFLKRKLNMYWRKFGRMSMKAGGSSWFTNFIGNLTATGWFAVPNLLEQGSMTLDYWEPIEFYPEFSMDGLERAARVITMPGSKAYRFIESNGWDTSGLPNNPPSNMMIYILWKMVDDEAHMGAATGLSTVELRPMAGTGLSHIPIIGGAVGSIPTNISSYVYNIGGQPIIHKKNFSHTHGQSIIATNAEVYRTLNRQTTFMQQILRDTSMPVTWERTQGGSNSIVGNVEDLTKRHAHFRLGPQDELGVMDRPGVPADLTNLLFQIRNMIQRGGISDVVFGNLLGEVNSILVSQAAEAVNHVINPYKEAIMFVASEASTLYIKGLMSGHVKANELEREATKTLREYLQVTEDAVIVEADYQVKIPGDTANRINMAKFASPNWRLSPETANSLFFPEITDYVTEQNKIDQSDANNHPSMQSIKLISSLERAAIQLDRSDPRMARLLRQQAGQVAQQIQAQGQQGQDVGLQTNVLPRQEQL